MRKVMVMLGAMTLLGSMLAAGPATAQELPSERDLLVNKIVDGESEEGFVIEVECVAVEGQVEGSWELPYLPDGSPDPDAPAEVLDDWEIVDGSWLLSLPILESVLCSAIEIEDGGADSVTYACEYIPAEDSDQDFGTPCEDTDLDSVASVLFPAGPLAGSDVCSTSAGPLPEECIDSAVLTVTNTFDEEPEPDPEPEPEPELDPEVDPELEVELELDDISAVTATPTFTG